MPGNHVLLETIELSQNAASVTFDNIPQTGYTDLKVVASARSNRGAFEDSVHIRLGNGTIDSGLNYTYTLAYEYGGGNLTSQRASSQNSIVWQSPVTASNATGSTFGNSYFELPNYTSSVAKSVTCDSTTEHNGVENLCGITAGSWTGTSAVNIITLQPTTGTAFLTGSTFSIYGVAATGTTPTVAPKANGGNIVANDGTYWYHAFLTSGNFIPQTPISCDVLQVAGGGSGGRYNGGGGGAGGVLAFASQALTAINYAVTIGAGGAPTTGNTIHNGNNGTNSQFGSLTASKGGGGAGGGVYTALTGGGSGGGAGTAPAATGATGTSGQGNNGGNSNDTPNYGGGGGGGAGGAGGNPTTSVAGAGGAGTNSVTNWGALSAVLTATNLGVSGYIAGGGGGSGEAGYTNGAAGSGGAGAGAATVGIDAVASTGSGGGATGSGNTGTTTGRGASGLVIIRYAMV
jgi:hypothetical protein